MEYRTCMNVVKLVVIYLYCLGIRNPVWSKYIVAAMLI